MTLVPETFEWDEAKARSNLAKHGLSFEDATAIFNEPDLIIVPTIRLADKELRFKAIGHIRDELFTVIYTERIGATRIISARRANASEEREYGDRQIQTRS